MKSSNEITRSISEGRFYRVTSFLLFDRLLTAARRTIRFCAERFCAEIRRVCFEVAFLRIRPNGQRCTAFRACENWIPEQHSIEALIGSSQESENVTDVFDQSLEIRDVTISDSLR